VELAAALRSNGVTGADISGNLSSHEDLVAFCSTLNIELVSGLGSISTRLRHAGPAGAHA
jgi:hypothetical protein